MRVGVLDINGAASSWKDERNSPSWARSMGDLDRRYQQLGSENNWGTDKLEDRYSNIRDEAVKGKLYDSHRHLSGRVALLWEV